MLSTKMSLILAWVDVLFSVLYSLGVKLLAPLLGCVIDEQHAMV
jgi:hypothetical protein